MKKNVSYAQPLLEEIHEKRGRAHEDSELRGMIKDMNTKLIEQKIVVAKLNKLCLGALTSVEHLAKKGKVHICILRRPQNFATSSPYF